MARKGYAHGQKSYAEHSLMARKAMQGIATWPEKGMQGIAKWPEELCRA
jgi:hypothetical protein